MDSPSLLVIWVTALGKEQESGLVMCGGSLVGRVGADGGGTSGVSSSRLGSLCTGALAGTVWVLACSGTVLNSVEVIGVRFGASTPPLGSDVKCGLAMLNPVGRWPARQLVRPSGA